MKAGGDFPHMGPFHEANDSTKIRRQIVELIEEWEECRKVTLAAADNPNDPFEGLDQWGEIEDKLADAVVAFGHRGVIYWGRIDEAETAAASKASVGTIRPEEICDVATFPHHTRN